MKSFVFILTFFILVMIISSCSKKDYENELKSFIDEHLKTIKPLNKEYALAFWNANLTGEKRYYDEVEKLDLMIRKIYSNKSEFNLIKEIKEKGEIKDTLLKRQLIVLYNSYLSNQMDTTLMKEIVKINSEITSKFNNFRGKIDGKDVTDNDISIIFKDELNSEKRKKAWETSKQVGKEIEKDLIKLVTLRNQIASKIGFKNYFEMSLNLSEQNEDELISIFNKLKESTDQPFKEMKTKIDENLSKKFNIKVEDLRPWHYEDPFFQKVPQITNVDFDKFYKGKNIEKISNDFYNGFNMNVNEIIKNSDLYERKGKYQHAQCMDIDREGDVRTMQNLKDNAYWMETMMHELGHAVYSKYIDRNLPYLIRTDAHILTTEAIAQLMERQAKNPEWMQKMLGINDKEKEEVATVIKEEAKLKSLIFCRWSLVMLFFEKSMYENPDQDLNKLWWDMVEKFQFLKRPEERNEPDYAAKIHLSQAPVYYHNYQLGELMASQLMNYISKNIEKQDKVVSLCFIGKPEIGSFLKEKVFKPGAKFYWNDLIKFATGENLNPDFYINEFIKE